MLSDAVMVIASAVILFHCLCTLNGMHTRQGWTKGTLKRAAYILMSCGSFGIAAAPFLGGYASGRWPVAALLAGMAVYVIAKQLARNKAKHAVTA